MITSKQCKAARVLLGWTAKDLATKAGVGLSVVTRFETNDANIRASSIEAIIRAFSEANIALVGTTGIIEKEDTVEVLKGDDCVEKLWNNILTSLTPHGGEILITNVDEKRALNSKQGDLLSYLDTLKQSKITERLLSCEGDDFFLMPQDCYRWIPNEVFNMGTSTYVYANKVAFQLWGEKVIILVHSKDANEAEKQRFEYMWENAKIPTNNKKNI